MRTVADLTRDLLKNDEFKDELLNLIRGDKMNESYIPQKYLYHATYGPYVNTIKAKGLLTNPSSKTWRDCYKGRIYLSTDPEVAYSYAEGALHDAEDDNVGNADIYILRINTKFINPEKLHPDSNILWDDDIELSGFEYEEDIPYIAIEKIWKY